MTHNEWIKSKFNVICEYKNSIMFDAYGDICCEINGQPFDYKTIDEFKNAVDFFEDETFEM